jgi:hypothetical protein
MDTLKRKDWLYHDDGYETPMYDEYMEDWERWNEHLEILKKIAKVVFAVIVVLAALAVFLYWAVSYILNSLA